MSFRKKLLVVFLIFSICPMVFVTSLIFHNSEKYLQKLVITKLNEIADYKTDRIRGFFSDLSVQIKIAQDYWNIKANLPILEKYINDKENPAYIKAKETLDSQLITLQKLGNLYDVMLVNAEGKISYTISLAHEKELGESFPLPLGKDSPLGVKEIYLSGIFRNGKYENSPVVFITAPLYDKAEYLGGIVFEVKMAPVYAIIQDTKYLGESGEVFLGKKIGRYAIFLSPTRFDKEAALKRRIPFGGKEAISLQSAVRGGNGSGIAIDYRGKEVLTVWRYLPEFDWGLVVKFDTQEAFALIYKLKIITALLICITGFLVIFMALVILRSFSEPIQILRKGTHMIAKGDLNYRVNIKTNDEIGQLSREFDEMAENLKKITASRDELNKEILARNRLEGELIKTRQEADIANRKKSEFLANMSHELRTPLNSIIGFSEILRDELYGKLNEKQAGYAGLVISSGRHLLSLIDDILDLSKVESGKITLEKEKFLFKKDLLESALDMLKEKALKHGIKLSLNFNFPGDFEAETDLRKLKQVMCNLLSNAVKFTPDGGTVTVTARKVWEARHSEGGQRPTEESKRIDPSASPQDDKSITVLTESGDNNFIEISVQDTGIGIKQEDLPKLFQEFSQIESAYTKKFAGTGLGLALSKKLIEFLGGKIWAESEFGKGAKFTFVLPLL